MLENHSVRTAAQVSGSLFLGRHTLKAGVAYEDNALDQVFANSAEGGRPSITLRVAPSAYVGVYSYRDVTLHLFSPRRAVNIDQTHYLARDEKGNPDTPNPNYGNPKGYQPPMTARLGVEVDF